MVILYTLITFAFGAISLLFFLLKEAYDRIEALEKEINN